MRDESFFQSIVSGAAGPWAAPVRALLHGASLAYGQAIRLHNRKYDDVTNTVIIDKPVVSVGNLTVGGTGKTPMVIYVASCLERLGYNPAVVARGYKSVGGQPNDEALLFKKRCPNLGYVANPDRVEGARDAIDRLGADVVILDDGFQHRRLARGLDILLVDATCPFGHGHLLPRGLLREPLSALRRADVIVLTRCDQASSNRVAQIKERVAKHAPDVPVLTSMHKVAGMAKLDGSAFERSLEGQRVVVVAGIGRPSAFVSTAKSHGATVVARQFFPDHHRFNANDIHKLVAPGRFPPYDYFLITEKDAVKIASLPGLEAYPFLMLRIDIDFDDGGGKIFESLIHGSLARREEAMSDIC